MKIDDEMVERLNAVQRHFDDIYPHMKEPLPILTADEEIEPVGEFRGGWKVKHLDYVLVNIASAGDEFEWWHGYPLSERVPMPRWSGDVHGHTKDECLKKLAEFLFKQKFNFPAEVK